jgi:hypothetical protein
MYMLAEHPGVLKRLREEIATFVGASKTPDYDDIRQMKYLRAILNGETVSPDVYLVLNLVLQKL